MRAPTMDEKLDHTLALFAKLLCSGVFVGERVAADYVRRDLMTHVRPEGMPVAWDEITWEVDADGGRVTLSAHGVSRSAIFNPGLGCTILPRDGSGLHFTPVPIESTLLDADSRAWPEGDVDPYPPHPEGVNHAALDAALDLALDDARQPVPQETRALLVVHRGKIIGERYASGFGPDSRHVSWSMGKSITSALIGMLVGEAELNIDDPAPIAEWQGVDDPRRAITLRQLLNMSSGLQFIRAQDDDQLDLGWTSRDDHMYIYFGGIDVFEHAVTRPQEYAPGTFWRYRNCDPLTLGKVVRQTVEARGEDYLTFPQRRLFDRIGMRRMVLEPDPWGNFVMTGFDWGTARDWARFGLLHLWDGVWQPTGERILPEGWVDFVRTPAPANAERDYGGQFWLNAGGRLPNVPRDTFWPAGAWGQVVLVVPSRDLVVVRLGHSLDTGDAFDAYVDTTLANICEALGE